MPKCCWMVLEQKLRERPHFENELRLAFRLIREGVQVRVGKWLTDLEKNFYGSSLAYDKVQLPNMHRQENTE